MPAAPSDADPSDADRSVESLASAPLESPLQQLHDLDARQDQLLRQLDELNSQILAALDEATGNQSLPIERRAA